LLLIPFAALREGAVLIALLCALALLALRLLVLLLVVLLSALTIAVLRLLVVRHVSLLPVVAASRRPTATWAVL
jgi:hypothetical protein